MSGGGTDPSSTRCKLLWTLSRMHTWSGFTQETDLLTAALDTEGHDKGQDILEDLTRAKFTVFQRSEGIRLKNHPDSQAIVAFELRDACNYTEIHIEATLSRFSQRGGFDAYDEPPVAN